MLTFSGIRAITPKDRLFQQATKLRHTMLFAPFGVPETRDFQDGDPASVHLVYVDRGEVMGYGRLVTRGAQAQIRHVCVDSRLQGKGIGTKLLDALIERAGDAGAGMVYLNARFTALGVYRRVGFREVGELMPAEDVKLPHRRMELIL